MLFRAINMVTSCNLARDGHVGLFVVEACELSTEFQVLGH